MPGILTGAIGPTTVAGNIHNQTGWGSGAYWGAKVIAAKIAWLTDTREPAP